MKRLLTPALLAAMLIPSGGTALADDGPCVLSWFDSDDNPAIAINWSPDEQLVFSHGLDGTVRVWSANGGPPLASLPDQQHVGPYRVVLSPDGTLAAITGQGYSTVVVKADTLEEVWRVPEGGVPSSFSSDGRYLATGRYGVARVFDAATGDVVAEHVVPEGKAGYMYFHADFLAGDRWILLVDPAAPPRLWDWQADKMHGLKFRNGGLIAAVSDDRTRFVVGGDLEDEREGWRVWDASAFLEGRSAEPKIIQRRLPSSFVHSFTHDGKQLISGWMDGWITFWDIDSGKKVARIAQRTGIGGAYLSADGQRLLAGGRPARIYLLEGQDYFEGPVPMRCTEPSAA